MNPSGSADLATWLTERYGIFDPAVRLLRGYTNDVYLVASKGIRWVLKCYAADWRNDASIRWELDLLRHLHACEIQTPLSVAGSNGDHLQHIGFGDGDRQAVLFSYAPGHKPQPPFAPELYAREARSVATIHAALDTFMSPHHRSALDLDTVLWQPLQQIMVMAPSDPATSSLAQSAHIIAGRLRPLIDHGLDWGPCHGDVTFDNVHLTDDGSFVWYDFDSGGPGWRALDLQGWAAHCPEHHERFEAFISGYRDVKPLAEADVAAAPLLQVAQDVWGIAVDLQRRVLARGSAAVREHLDRESARIASRLDQLTG